MTPPTDPGLPEGGLQARPWYSDLLADCEETARALGFEPLFRLAPDMHSSAARSAVRFTERESEKPFGGSHAEMVLARRNFVKVVSCGDGLHARVREHLRAAPTPLPDLVLRDLFDLVAPRRKSLHGATLVSWLDPLQWRIAEGLALYEERFPEAVRVRPVLLPSIAVSAATTVLVEQDRVLGPPRYRSLFHAIESAVDAAGAGGSH